MTVISGPVPPYANPPINADFYSPNVFIISAITLGATTTVTTTTDLNFVISQLVRLIIPPSFGCRQLNGQTGYVLSVPSSTQVVLNIYSAGGDPFIASSARTKAQILPIGDISCGAINSNGRMSNSTYIPGSFLNIS